MKELIVSEHLKNNYEGYYTGGDSEWRWLGAIDKAENIVSLCNNYPHGSVVEIGAGEGSILKRLSELGFGNEFYALEISPTGVETIKKKRIPRLMECALYDGYNIPYEDNKFDLAVLSHVIEHVEYPRKLLYEAIRVARYVFLEVPLEDTIRLSPDFVFEKVGHINSYSPKTIKRLVQTCNLTVLDQKVTNPSKLVYTYQKGQKGLINYFIKEWLLRVLPGVAVGIFTYHSALICEKTKQLR